ncbi:MAG TPA: LysR family transcriptional regulator [Candidatus Agrococcus pullicola]|uniref:LysR family transcriptional regulator n=1 Tax=Candidatus Agrococcus pullicola TaxID=2838429 RepID=A0A9D2C8R0_9MICO|nr:LysR family transcriptional regulator [Candidatus Agrococcus pullicola]
MVGAGSWDALRVFIVVLRAGSFSAAADELGLARSSVSEQVARLERSLGRRLLERGSFGVRPTERGLELATRVAGPIDALAGAASLHRESEASTRSVFVGGPAEFLSEMILPRLMEALPDDLRVVTRFGQTEELIGDLRAGVIDVLIGTVPVNGAELSSEPIYEEELVLVGNPVWAEEAEDDLDAVPVIAQGPELPLIRGYWRGVFERHPYGLTARAIAPDPRTLLRLALDGAGMTVLPDYLVREHLESGALIELGEPETAPVNTLHVATRAAGATPDAAVVLAREAIVAAAREVPVREAP